MAQIILESDKVITDAFGAALITWWHNRVSLWIFILGDDVVESACSEMIIWLFILRDNVVDPACSEMILHDYGPVWVSYACYISRGLLFAASILTLNYLSKGEFNLWREDITNAN